MIESDDVDRLRVLPWRDLEQLVAEVVQHELPGYVIQRDARIGSLIVDILAEPVVRTIAQKSVVFEVKKVAVASIDLVVSQVGRRDVIREHVPEVVYILVTTGGITKRAREVAVRHGMTLWDANDLISRITPDISAKWFGVTFHHTEHEQREPTKAQALMLALGSIAGGKAQAIEYQKWVRDVMEHLFVPPLGPVQYENTDMARRNRRDLILENWAADGFWAQMRTLYSAEQVVVDAKNSAQPLSKRPIIEIAHYLKSYGCGLFGVLCCRKGPGEGAIHAIREQWIASKKLLIILSDDIMLEMLALKAAGAPPEELLRREIGRFRMAL